MDQATLAGIPGAGKVRARRRSEVSREYRGVFAFPREHGSRLAELLASRETVEYVGVIGGGRRRLKARVTDLSPASGLAYFQGLSEPYDEPSEARAGWAR